AHSGRCPSVARAGHPGTVAEWRRADSASCRWRAVRPTHLAARVHGRAVMLGAHVSSQGGVAAAPRRGGALRATAIQLFTKTPNQWRERDVSADVSAEFRREV